MPKLIKCKSCGKEISSNAKECPFCGGKNKKPFYKKWWVWVIAAIVVIGAAGGGKTSQKPTTDTPQSTETAAANKQNKLEETVYSVGDTVTTDKFEITVKNVQTKTSVGTQYLSSTPSEGGVYVCVDFEYKNISQKPVAAYSCPKIKLKDPNGTSYDGDISAGTYYATETDPDRKVLSDLNPDIKVKDSAVFEISKTAYEAGGFTVCVDADKDFDVKIN